jgi:hypothetical protein
MKIGEERIQAMKMEGWMFSNPTNIPSYLRFVYQTVRRFFPGHGAFDGVVLAYLAPDKDSAALWHVLHEDGKNVKA